MRIADTPAGATVVAVQPGSASEGELRAGDVIVGVNHLRVHNAVEVGLQVRKAPPSQPILLKIHRANQDRFVGIEPK